MLRTNVQHDEPFLFKKISQVQIELYVQNTQKITFA
jgi:hypothetical protein